MICLLCGAEGATFSMARYRDGTYAALPRCRDAIACERRVLANGDTWDLSAPQPPERPRAPRSPLTVIRGGRR